MSTGENKTPGFRSGKAESLNDAGFRTVLADHLSERDVEGVVQHAKRQEMLLVEAAVMLGFLDEMTAYAAFAEWQDKPFVDLRTVPPTSTAARLLPERVSRGYQILPMAHDNRNFTYASASMFNAELDRDVAFASGRRTQMVVVAKGQLLSALGDAYRMGTTIDKLIDRIKISDMVKPAEVAVAATANESPVIDLCNQIIATAIAAGASDVHIEPAGDGAVVRHRICGILEPLLNLPESAVRGVTNRFKLMAKADIATKFKPQDGAFRVNVDSQPVDVRLSTVPTIHGEKIVMRVIPGAGSAHTIDTLGYDAAAQRALIGALSKPDGLVLVTGPTGSGKTTVLYAALQFLATGRVNIVTVEDPVERQVGGVTQIAVNSKSGTSFANVLRSVMRQDPNVIMVGEVRDPEVAEIVGQAAYTGHLVLSTLHTIDAASAITRLVNLGLQPFKIAESLNAVVAQRLLRKLCPHCKISYDGVNAARQGVKHGLPQLGAAVGRGCEHCKQTGYVGRVAIPEILLPDEGLRTAIRNGAGVGEIRAAMHRAGSPSMRETAIALAIDGTTSIEEVNRVFTNHEDAVPAQTEAVDDAAEAQVPEIALEKAPEEVAEAVAGVAEKVPEKSPEKMPVLGPRPVGPRPPSRRILIADDDRMIRLIMRMLLEKEGFKVLEAENGAVAMATARRERPDLMFVDLQMPDMDGFQVLEMVRADADLAGTPVIVLTSETASAVETKVLELGADDYVVKPFEPEVLLSRLRAAFRRVTRAA